jgi:AraC family transcriptional regulator
MRTQPQRAHTTESLASVAALSPYHFNRVFRRVTGIPPAQYLCGVRIHAARHLLLTTSLSVTEVSLEVGYNSLGTFVTRFTQLVGVSPNALRRAAETFEPARLRELLECDTTGGAQLANEGDVYGWIQVPSGFEGLIFIGIFRSLIPHAAPLRCQLLGRSGGFRLASVPSGSWHVATVGIPWSNSLVNMLAGGFLQASIGPIDLVANTASMPLHLSLRPPESHEPPILAALPLLALYAVKDSEGTYVGNVRPVGHVVQPLLQQ